MQPGLAKLGLLLMALAIGSPGPTFGAEPDNLAQLRERALGLVNQERQERGLASLNAGEALDKAAQAHAEDMLQRDYYDHISPEGDTVMDRYVEAGGTRWHLTAENIARCQDCPTPPTADRVESLHEGWMNSPPHRENILRRGLDKFGFGMAFDSNGSLYAVQTFAGPGEPRGGQPGEEARAIGPDRQTELALQRINKERRAQNLEPLGAHESLVRAASGLVPENELKSAPDLQGSLAEALPEGARREWRSLAAIAGRCGGCGAQAVRADVRFFVQQWLDDPDYRSRLLSKEATHLGLVIRANGAGLKAAAAIIAQHR